MVVSSSVRHFLLALVLLLLLFANQRANTAPFSGRRYHHHDYFDDEDEDLGTSATRAERSANISHILGSSRKIQLVVNKYWHLQLLPDGTVNGTDTDIDSDYTILQRSSLSFTQITIQGVATCKYLCMDHCGLLYGSKEYSDECVFNEVIEAHNFNTYSSAKYSNEKQAMYLALNKKGMPRKVQTKPRMLGKLATYVNVLTKTVAKPRVEALGLQMLKQKRFPKNVNLRHHGFHQFCANMRTGPEKLTKCRKKKKRKGKCSEEEICDSKGGHLVEKRKCEDGEEEEECLRRLHMIRRKRKSRVDDEMAKRKKRLPKKRDFPNKCRGPGGKDCLRKMPQISHENYLVPESTASDEDTSTLLPTDWTTSSAVTD